MSIRFACDACGRAYDLPDTAAGRQAKCECGKMLVVPTESTLVIPPVPPAPPEPKAKPKEERPPRTLHQAAEMARKEREKREAAEIDEAKLAAMVGESPDQPPSVTPPPTAAAPPPPPPPIVPPSTTDLPDQEGASAHPAPRKPAKKYKRLRALVVYLRVLSYVWAFLALMAALVQGVAVIGIVANGLADPITFIVSLAPIATTLLGGLLAYILLNAISEFLQVIMDIEENTRSHP